MFNAVRGGAEVTAWSRGRLLDRDGRPSVRDRRGLLWRLLCAVATLGALLASVVFSPSAAASDDVAELNLLSEAAKALAEHHYDRALTLARAALDENPSKAWEIIGVADCFLGHGVEALRAWKNVDADERSVIVRACASTIPKFAEAVRREEQEEAQRRAQQARRAEALAHLAKARELASKDAPEDAEREVDAAQKLGSDDPDLLAEREEIKVLIASVPSRLQPPAQHGGVGVGDGPDASGTDDPRARMAEDAARAGEIDRARLLASRLQTATADIEPIIHSLPVPALEVHSMAQSGAMDLRKFWEEWKGVLDGSRGLDLELASYAKAISHEELCDDRLDDNPFHRRKCDEFVAGLHDAIKEGFRRRWIVQDLFATASYDLKKERWSIYADGFTDRAPPNWFLRPPRTCGVLGSDCHAFCGDDRVALETAVKMRAADAEPIADVFPKKIRGRAVLVWVSSGTRKWPPCRFLDGGVVYFEIFRVGGIELTDTEGNVYAATGLFKQNSEAAKKR